MSPKKGQSVEVKADAIPAYIVKDVKMQEFVDGITIKEVKAAAEPVINGSEACNSDELPF